MTSEEEIVFLKGRVDALSQLCSFLIATDEMGDNLARMYRIKAEKELGRSELSTTERTYAAGYASVAANIETARKMLFGGKRGESEG